MQNRTKRFLGAALFVMVTLLAMTWQTSVARAAGLPNEVAGKLQVAVPQQATNVDAVNPSDVDHGPGHGGPGDNDEEGKFYGIVVSRPMTELVGSWVISGTTVVTFTVTEETEIEFDHGAPVAGSCVQVEYDEESPTVAREIETEAMYKCRATDDDDNDGQPDFRFLMFGKIVSLPDAPDLLGVWQVGDITFTVTTTTELLQDRVPFTVGVTVRVKGYEVDGEKVANQVKSYFRTGWHRPGPGHDNHCDCGRAFGPIEVLPADTLSGTWTIAGVDYIVNAETVLDATGTYTVGVKVKVEYCLEDDGDEIQVSHQGQERNRVATRIEIIEQPGNPSEPAELWFVGYAEEIPEDALGEWLIGGKKFVSDENTQISEEEGLLVEGALVVLQYAKVGEQRLILQLQVHVVPGGGDDNSAGLIEQTSASVLSASAGATPTWRIAGVDYVVNTATDLDDSTGPLTVGSLAVVNSYTNADGVRVATRIEGVTFTNNVFLPLADGN